MRNILCVSLILLSILTVSAQDSQDTPEGLLVFSARLADEESTYQIYLQDLETGKIRQLTDNDEENHQAPLFSPDCRNIAYHVRQSGINAPAAVYILSLEDDTHQRIDDKTDLNRRTSAWSPDGQYFAYEEGNEYIIYDTTTGEQEDTHTPRQSGTTSWSPDGNLFTYNATSSIIVIHDNTDHTEFYLDQSPGTAYAPQWSPVARHIAFYDSVTGENLQSNLMLLDFPDERDNIVVNEIDSAMFLNSIVWSPDGSSLIYVRRNNQEDTTDDIYVSSITEPNPQFIVDSNASLVRFDWEQDNFVLFRGLVPDIGDFRIHSLNLSRNSAVMQITDDKYDTLSFDWCIPADDEN